MKFKFNLKKKTGEGEEKKKKKGIGKIDLKNVSLWGFAALMSFLISLFCIGYFGYLKWQATRLSTEIKAKEEIMLVKSRELKNLTNESSYQKFLATKALLEKEGNWDWKETTTYLIELFDVLQAVDDDKSGVTLDQFAVHQGRVTFRGTVERIDYMYTPGGLLEELLGLDFIEFVSIPFYKRSQRGYDFTLDATIKEYDGVEGSL